jgi:nucleoside-diphosphate-sugar epimerase
LKITLIFMAFSGKHLLLVGGGGFIGHHVAEKAAVSNFASITVIGRGTPALSPDVSFVSVDLNDVSALRVFARKKEFDFIINLAGKIDQSSGLGIYQKQFAVNTISAMNLVDAFQGRTGRFIQVGSATEYGSAPCPQAPDGPAAPTSAYGVSKLAASRMVLARHCAENFPALVARPFLVYGEGQSPHSFLAKAISAAKARRVFPTTSGLQTRDFTPVEKVAAELLQLCLLPDACGKIYNICTGVEFSLKFVLEIIEKTYPGFSPQYNAIPNRTAEAARSTGVPFAPCSKQEVARALEDFIRA